MRLLFEESVNCRLRSAFPVGSHLSGGLDSSSVSIVAARSLHARGQQLEVFSWSPPPEPNVACDRDSEHLRIEAVCRAEQLTCHYLPATRESFFETFQGNFTVEPTEMMVREGNVQASAAAQGLRVMLSGWGGDEAVSNRAQSAPAEFFARRQWHEFWSAVESRMDVAEGPGVMKAARRIRRLGGIARDVTLPHWPNSFYSLFFNSIWLEHQNDCARPSFARLHRQRVLGLYAPAFRAQPGVRSTICHVLEYGHIPKRLEHWATSGTRHRLVYRYPLLDRRLVEFTLGVPTAQLCWQGTRLELFRRSISPLLPTSCDWGRRKVESMAILALGKIWFQAHEDWARRVIAEGEGLPPGRFVDPRSVSKAVHKRGKSERMMMLSGVREAYACYALEKLAPYK